MDNWRATSTNKLSACDLWKWSEKWSTAAVRRRCRYCNSYQSVTIWIQIMPCLQFHFCKAFGAVFLSDFLWDLPFANPLFWVANFSILSYCFGFILHFLYWFDIIWDCNHLQKNMYQMLTIFFISLKKKKNLIHSHWFVHAKSFILSFSYEYLLNKVIYQERKENTPPLFGSVFLFSFDLNFFSN